MGTFLVTIQKDNDFLVRAIFDDGETKWAKCSEAVHNYAKKAFKENEEVTLQYTNKNGKYYVTKIVKASGGGTRSDSNKTENTKSSSPCCEDCNKELKDSKYKKCWACNNKNYSKSTTTSSSSKSYKSPTTQDSIVRQSCMKGACDAVKTMAGQIDNVDTLVEAVLAIYGEIYKKVTE